MTKRNFATEFLLRELLQALGAPLASSKSNSDTVDSFSESLSEETESQTALTAASGQSRVMLVRRTNSSRQTATLVDREFDIEAFVPSHVSASLQRERGYQTLGRLRGSVVRVTKCHFATLPRCLSADQQQTETSVSAPNVNRGNTRVYLWVDALAIVEDNELAVQPHPEVYSHPLVKERLQMLNDAELEKQLMIHQGLPPLRVVQSDRFDDDRPLLEEDCVIPEDQEKQLEEQTEWGPPTIGRQPTDSQLIDENGSVPMPESQVVIGPTSQNKVQSTQESMTSSVTLSGNPTVSDVSMESMTSSVTLSGNPTVSDVSMESLDSQRFQFQQENIRETFVVESDVESDTDDEDYEYVEAKDPAPTKQQTDWSGKLSAHPSTDPTTTSRAIVDLTDDSPEKGPRPASISKTTKTEQHQEPKPEVDGSVNGTTEHLGTVHSPQSSDPHSQSKSYWKTIQNFASHLFSAEDSDQPSHGRGEESTEIEADATQIQDHAKDNKVQDDKEDKFAQPEEFISSQATVVLQYAMDNDEDANAFEYEGMISDDMEPHSSVVVHDRDDHAVDEEHATQVDDDLTLSEEGAEFSISPQKMVEPKEDSTGFKSPLPSAHAATPETKKRAETTANNTPTISTSSSPANSESPAHRSDPVSPRTSNDPILPTDPSGQLSPVKSPSKLVISVGCSGNNTNQTRRTGFSAVVPRGSKRRRQQDTAPLAITTTPRENTRHQDEDQPRTISQKRRRHDLGTSFEGGSQSPQFEQQATPLLSRRRLQSDHKTVIAGNYSLDAVCRSLGSNAREQNNEEDRTGSSRQPRRAWKRYESLFPLLNMTRLRQMMAESKEK